jgi:hypothetical protein
MRPRSRQVSFFQVLQDALEVDFAGYDAPEGPVLLQRAHKCCESGAVDRATRVYIRGPRQSRYGGEPPTMKSILPVSAARTCCPYASVSMTVPRWSSAPQVLMSA